MMPHMHFRGKDMTYTLMYPDGRKEVVLSVPHYDFNWQLGYSTSVKVPKGTKLHVDAHFDNSPNNKFNPNPNRTVCGEGRRSEQDRHGTGPCAARRLSPLSERTVGVVRWKSGS